MEHHPRLDTNPHPPVDTLNGSVVEATFNSYNAGSGMGEVTLPPGSSNHVLVPVEPGVYAPGQRVQVRLGRFGKPVGMVGPNTLPDGDTTGLVGVGGGQLALAAREEARQAWEEAKQARESISAVDSSVAAAQAVAEAAKRAVELNAQAIEAAKAASVAGDAALRGELARKAEELAKQAQDAMRKGQQAQDSADGKALVAYGPDRPATVGGQKIIWFNPGGVPELYDGSTWRSVQPGDGVVKALDIGKATVGELSGMRIKAGTASVDILIMGDNARWTSTGLTIYHPLSAEEATTVSPTDWDKRSVALDLTSDGSRFLSVANSAGEVTAFMAPTGEVSARSLMVTGQAQVDSLTVGGVALPDLIGGSGFETVGLTVIPELTHPPGTATVDLFKTEPVTLSPGLYRVAWPVNYIITRQGESALDASGAYVRPYQLVDGRQVGVKWADGRPIAEHWGAYYKDEKYGSSRPEGWLRVEREGQYQFIAGLHSYLKLKLWSWQSAVTIERAPEGKEVGHTLLAVPKPVVKPPAPVAASASLVDLQYAWGNNWAISGGYTSKGTFKIPQVKGKTIRSIKVTGKCNMSFIGGVEGAVFSFRFGGETRSVHVRNYESFTLVFGPTTAATLTRWGWDYFEGLAGASTYTTFDPTAFRLHVTYQQ